MSAKPEAGIEVKGAQKAASDLLDVGKRGRDVRPTRDRVRRIYLKSNERHLSSPGWPALSPETIARKTAQGLPSQPERATGALLASLTEQRSKGQINRASKSKMVFGSRLFYAPWQHGTKHQPKRLLIDLTPADRKQICSVLSRYVSSGYVT